MLLPVDIVGVDYVPVHDTVRIPITYIQHLDSRVTIVSVHNVTPRHRKALNNMDEGDRIDW